MNKWFFASGIMLTAMLRADAAPEVEEKEAPVAMIASPEQSLAAPQTLPSLGGLEPVQTAPKEVPVIERYKDPLISTALSGLFPGLGHLYLGDYATTGAFVGTVGVTLGAAIQSMADEIARAEAQNVEPRMTETAMTSMACLQNAWLYGLYSSYRDVRRYNKEKGYRYHMPNDSFMELTFAPLNWRIMKKPEVWGGITGALTLAVGATILSEYCRGSAHIFPVADTQEGTRSRLPINPFVALPVGIGEEAFFRGLLQSRLAETLSPWAAIATTTAIFTAMHIPNGAAVPKEDRWTFYTFSLPVIATLSSYFGWLTHKNRSLQESVAVHAWYDFTLFSLATMARAQQNETASKVANMLGAPSTVAISVPF